MFTRPRANKYDVLDAYNDYFRTIRKMQVSEALFQLNRCELRDRQYDIVNSLSSWVLYGRLPKLNAKSVRSVAEAKICILGYAIDYSKHQQKLFDHMYRSILAEKWTQLKLKKRVM